MLALVLRNCSWDVSRHFVSDCEQGTTETKAASTAFCATIDIIVQSRRSRKTLVTIIITLYACYISGILRKRPKCDVILMKNCLLITL